MTEPLLTAWVDVPRQSKEDRLDLQVDASALDMIELVHRHCKWTALKTTETWIRMRIA